MEAALALLAVVVAGVPIVGGVALYVIRAELRYDVTRIDGRISGHENGCTQRQVALAETLREIKGHANRIEDKIDRLVEAR